MGWIRWTGKTLEFAGKLAQSDSFERWADSQGEKILSDLALKSGGYVFGLGKAQKAKSLVWRELASIAESSPELNAAIQEFVASYPELLSLLASNYSNLPHINVDLCVVPRFLVNRNALIKVKQRLDESKELANLKGGASLREYFFEELVEQLDAVLTNEAAKASPGKPLEIDDDWVVGFNPRYEWKGQAGHYFIYSNYLRTAKAAKKEYRKDGKKESAELLTKCLSWLGTLSQKDREMWESKLP